MAFLRIKTWSQHMAFILKYACIIRLILLLDKIMREVKPSLIS